MGYRGRARRRAPPRGATESSSQEHHEPPLARHLRRAPLRGPALAVVPALAAAGLLTRGRRGRRARTGALLALGGLALALLAARHVTGLGAAVDGTGVRLATG